MLRYFRKPAISGRPPQKYPAGALRQQMPHQYHRNDHARDLLFRVETLHGLLGDDALVDHGPGELLLYAEQAHGVEHARRHDEEGKQGNGRVEQQDGEACGLSVQENPSYSK
mgnify:CR=1 FL=1